MSRSIREQPEPGGAATTARGGVLPLLFPHGVRLWHFIAIPAVGMGLLILLFRWVDDAVTNPEIAHSDLYQISRIVIMGTAMATLIAWLAFSYRRDYEAKLRARNDALEATRDFLAGVIERSGEAIITLDDDGLVSSWNPAAEEIYGWTREEMLGEPLDRLLPSEPVWTEQLAENDLRVRSGMTVHHFEAERIRKDGARITVHITRSPLYDRDGRYSGSMGIVHDVSEVKEMEARLRAQETLAAVGQLAASVAHEIKNPLAGIRGACEIIADGYRDDDPKKELATEVLRQVDRLNRTVHDLLVFARPRSKKPVPCDVHDILDRVLNILGEDVENDAVEVDRRYAARLPTVLVDPQQMEQVFFNLVLNAFQAVQHRGRVSLTTKPNGENVLISIRDTGPGVPADVADRIFEPFFTTRAKGSGLGLPIVRNIVRDHGGDVTLVSEPGAGAEFVVALPRER